MSTCHVVVSVPGTVHLSIHGGGGGGGQCGCHCGQSGYENLKTNVSMLQLFANCLALAHFLFVIRKMDLEKF